MITKNILITGASGLIGTRLTEMLLEKGHHVVHLSRSRKGNEAVKTFTWDIDKFQIEAGALDGITTIVHLAGAGIADKPWTEKRKKEIIESRTRSTALLHQTLSQKSHHITEVISSSAMGYYGLTLEDKVFTEESPAGDDFVAQVTIQWEKEIDKIAALGIRTVKLRTGIVLSSKGGALKTMAKPVKFYAGAPLGTGKQMMSWLHIDDMCGMYIKAIEDNAMQGAYNAAAPHPVTNRELTKGIAQALDKPMFLPAVPPFVLKLLLGEMAEMVLLGTELSTKKIEQTGFHFKFPYLHDALRDLLK